VNDFIEVYPDALPVDDCRRIIEQFEASGQATRGRTDSGVDTTLKDSYDITVTGRPEWREVDAALQRVAFQGLRHYIRKYPFLLIGPLAMRCQSPSGELTLTTADNFASLNEENYLRMLTTVFRPGSINLQKYIAGQGGYPHWHSELYPRDARCETLHRVLL
jgi:hypothetical protein